MLTAESKVLPSLQYHITLDAFETHQNSTPEMKTKIRFLPSVCVFSSSCASLCAFDDVLNWNYSSQLNYYVMHKFMYDIFLLHVFQN